MKLLYKSVFLEHDTGSHPENKRRLERLVEHFQLEETECEDGLELITAVHPPAYVNYIRQHCHHSLPLDGDTLVVPHSFQAATQAVGLTMKAAREGGFALVRPPGHHAYREKASGFCLFNNIAIAAQQLVNEGKRVAIIDFDGHLGDGTEAIFYGTDKVLFWSLHQHPAFPFKGFVDEIGEGVGRGFTINTPLPSGSGDDIFADAFQHFLPLVEEFQPDVIGFSAGFDAYQFDPLLQLNLTQRTFHWIGRQIRDQFPETPTFAVLEGGYNTDDLPSCVDSFLAGMNGQKNPFPVSPTSSGRSTWETYEIHVHAALGHLQAYWDF